MYIHACTYLILCSFFLQSSPVFPRRNVETEECFFFCGVGGGDKVESKNNHVCWRDKFFPLIKDSKDACQGDTSKLIFLLILDCVPPILGISDMCTFYIILRSSVAEPELRAKEPKLNCLPGAGVELLNCGSGSFLFIKEVGVVFRQVLTRFLHQIRYIRYFWKIWR